MDDGAAPEERGENPGQPDRDDQGRFLEGNSIGEDTRWTKDNHPRGGRTKRRHFTKALLRHMDQPASESTVLTRAAQKLGLDPNEATGWDVMMASAILHGIKGKSDVLKQLWERVEGAVPKTLSLDVDDPVRLYLEDMRMATQPPPPETPAPDPSAGSEDQDRAEDEDRDEQEK